MTRQPFSTPAAIAAIVGAVCSLMLLVVLHVLSPEFSPAWRMISEYGNGRYEWVLTLMFIIWGSSTLSLAFALRGQTRGKLGRTGLALLVVAGAATVGGGLFDINNEPGHSISGFLGILALPPAAMVTSVALGRVQKWSVGRRPMLIAAHLTWISLALFGLAFPVMMLSFIHVQGSLPTMVPASLPNGVIALVGWANRLLMLTYCAWVIVVASVGVRSTSVVASTADIPSGRAQTEPAGT